MANLTPNNRQENWYKGIVDGSTDLTPNNRREYWYQGMIDGSTDLTPNNRREAWYKAIVDSKGGGGGGSNVRIVHVTIEKNAGLSGVSLIAFGCCVPTTEDEGGISVPTIPIYEESADKFEIPIALGFDGTALVFFATQNGDSFVSLPGGEYEITATGDIEVINEGVQALVVISGDGSVLISGGK